MIKIRSWCGSREMGRKVKDTLRYALPTHMEMYFIAHLRSQHLYTDIGDSKYDMKYSKYGMKMQDPYEK